MNPAAPDDEMPKAEMRLPAAADSIPALTSLERMSDALDGVEAALGRRARWFQDGPLKRYSIRAEAPGGGPGLLARWGDKLSVLRPSFDVDSYLCFNADVMGAVSGGGFHSAFSHWTRYGRREGREGGGRSAAVARGRVEGPAGLNLYGFLTSVSGLGTAARSVKKAVEASGLAGAYFDLPNWEQAAEGGAGVERGAYRTNLLFQNSDVLPRFARAYGQRLLAERYNIAHCVWELPSLRADWAENLRYVDEVWTPSEFNRAAYQAATPLPVRVVPYTVDGLEQVATLGRAELGVPEGVFLFSYVFDVSSGFERKNPLALLAAFQAEFGGSRDAYLLLKCFNGKYNPGRMAMLRRRASADNIGLVEEVWTEAQIHTLHKVTDCFVSPHRGEGFGLNIAETMYFGNAVVATNYGANVDFMDEGNSYPAGYRLVEIEESTGPYLKGSVWAEVDVGDLARQMRRAFEDTAERRRRGVAAARTIREKYSAEAVGRVIRERLAEIDQPVARHPERPMRFLPAEAPGRVRAEVHQMRERPRISVIAEVEDGEKLKRCVDSVRAQWYPYWELCLCGDAAAYQGMDPRIKVLAGGANRGAEFATGEWVVLLGQEDSLTPDALLCVARALGEQPDLDVLYTDDAAGEKPEWSPEQLQGEMYMRRMMVVRKRLFWELGGFRAEMGEAREYDLALRLAGRTNRIGHLPKVLYHGRTADGLAGRRALEEFVRREKLAATVEPGLSPGLFRLKYRVVGQPKVTLVILAGGEAGGHLGLGRRDFVSVGLPLPDGRGSETGVERGLETGVERGLETGVERGLETGVERGLETGVERGLETGVERGSGPGVERGSGPGVERGSGPGVEELVRSIVEKTAYPNYEIFVAHGGELRVAEWQELVVLINADAEVRGGGWLEALLEYAQQPWIGAVYPSRDPGVRNYSATAGGCLATRRSLLEEVGGAAGSAGPAYGVALRERGYRVVYTPYSEIY